MEKRSLRKLHRQLAPILFIPFFLTATTGIIYRIGNSWFGMPAKYAKLMMYIHQGTFVGDQLKPIYVLLNGLGLIAMLVSGIVMSGIFSRSKRPQE
ncbi:MAG: peptidase [Coleofasciculaceae cyanobacterium]